MESSENQKKMQALFLELVRRQQSLQKTSDRGFDIWNHLKQDIDEIFKIIREVVLPEYPDLDTVIHKETRPQRNYENELNRLWAKALDIFGSYFETRISPALKLIIEDSSQEGKSNIKEMQVFIFWKGLIPTLAGHGNPGDDLYLYVNHAMLFSDEELVSRMIAKNLDTPHHSPEAIFGICGLLLQSHQASKNGSMDEAYSYLIDASHMLGMYHSSEYIMERFDTVADSRKARINAEKRHSTDTRFILGKARARELFYSLREEGPDGIRPMWKSASKAMTAISKALVREIAQSNRTDIKISDSKIYDLCKELCKQERHQKECPDFGIIPGYRLKDGTFIHFDDL
jgi:hypothetical protein